MSERSVRLGRAGEDAALETYRAHGSSLIARNWRCDAGEVDLIVRRGGTLVVCEVKTRRGQALGGGYEAVTRPKQQRLRRLAAAFLAEHREHRGSPVRFDVASVSLRGPRLVVRVFEDAF